MIEKIHTERLLLKIVQLSDAENVLRLRTNPEVTQFMTRDTNINLIDIEEFINERLLKDYYYTIHTKKSKEFIGSIVLWNIDNEKGYAEIGYELLPEFHKKGFMSEALVAIIDLAFEELKFKLLEASTHLNNGDSRSLLESKNFKFLQHKSDERYVENVIYQLHKTDFIKLV
jgi:ribosomal-protein-alanine N-acetyltransferase